MAYLLVADVIARHDDLEETQIDMILGDKETELSSLGHVDSHRNADSSEACNRGPWES